MVTAGRLLSKPVFAGLALVVVSCSDSRTSDSRTSDSRTSDSRVFDASTSEGEISFSQWCSDWALNCEAPAEFPKSPFTLGQVKSASGIANAFLGGQSRLVLSAQDWNSQGMKDAFAQFMQAKMHEQIAQKMGKMGFAGASTDGTGNLRLAFSGSDYLGPSGLRWQPAADSSISFGSNGDILFSGVTLSASSGAESVVLEGTRIADENTFVLEASRFRVTDVPFWFVSREFFDGLKLDSQQKIPFKNLAVGANRLLGVVLGRSQSVTIDSSLLANVSRDYDVLVPKPKDPVFWHDALKKVVGRLNSLNAVVGGGKANVAGQLSGSENLSCSIEGTPVIMEIRKDFGVSIPVQNAADRVVLAFHGIAAKLDLPGPAKPGFDLAAVEFTGEKVVIKGVPLLGQYSVDLTKQQSGKKMDFKCK